MTPEELREKWQNVIKNPLYSDQLRLEMIFQMAKLNENFTKFFSHLTPTKTVEKKTEKVPEQK